MATATLTDAPVEITSAITLTAGAAETVKDLIAQQERDDLALRVYVAGGGCSGLQYGMALDENSFARFAALLCAACRETGTPPPAFVLEGGYDLGALSRSVTATMLGAHEDAPDMGYVGGVEPVERSREELAPFWESLR